MVYSNFKSNTPKSRVTTTALPGSCLFCFFPSPNFNLFHFTSRKLIVRFSRLKMFYSALCWTPASCDSGCKKKKMATARNQHGGRQNAKLPNCSPVAAVTTFTLYAVCDWDGQISTHNERNNCDHRIYLEEWVWCSALFRAEIFTTSTISHVSICLHSPRTFENRPISARNNIPKLKRVYLCNHKGYLNNVGVKIKATHVSFCSDVYIFVYMLLVKSK